MDSRQARKEVLQWLSDHSLPFHKVKAETVSFADLTRGSSVFVSIQDWDYQIFPAPSAEQSRMVFAELKAYGKAHGFIVSA